MNPSTKRLRGLSLWLLLFVGGVLLGRQLFPPQAQVTAAETEAPAPVIRQGTARVAPLSEAKQLLEGGGSPESLRDLEASELPQADNELLQTDD